LFCDAIGVSQNAFYVRRRQLAEQGWLTEQRQPSQQSAAAGFVSLTLGASDSISDDCVSAARGSTGVSAREAALVEIELPGGALVRVIDAQAVREVVSVILEHGAQR
jgi:hypothetical protein